MNTENKKLTEMLSIMCENYNALHNHLKELTRKISDYELSNSRKRKADSEDNTNNIHTINRNHTESVSSDEESSKKPRESSKGKVSRVVVKTDKSDNTLVGSGQGKILMNNHYKRSCSIGTKNNLFVSWDFAASEGWISMEKVWAEGHQR